MGNGRVRKTVGHLQNQGIDAAGTRRRSLQTHLNSETSLDVALSLVVLPDDSELDDSLGDLDDLEGLLVLGVLLEELREGKGRKGVKISRWVERWQRAAKEKRTMRRFGDVRGQGSK